MSTTTRRGALLGSALAGLIGGAAVAKAAPASPLANPDANLIALCAEATRCEEHIRQIDQSGTAPEEECAAACTAWDKTYRQIADLPAMTLAGIQAKARILGLAVVREAVWSDGFDEYLEDPAAISHHLRADDRIARSLCHDILALGGAA